MNDLLPSEFYLGQNYPNPFNEKTTIKYCVAYKTRVRITVFNTEGELIEKLVDEDKNVGTHKIEFSAKCKSAAGGIPVSGKKRLASGIYHYQLKAGNYLAEKEMILLR